MPRPPEARAHAFVSAGPERAAKLIRCLAHHLRDCALADPLKSLAAVMAVSKSKTTPFRGAEGADALQIGWQWASDGNDAGRKLSRLTPTNVGTPCAFLTGL